MGALERARLARRGRLGGGGARQPAVRIPVERGTRRARGGHRHRRARRAHGLLGAAVRDAGLGRGPARRPRPRQTSAVSPACTPPRATRASRDGPRRRARTRTERPSWRPTPATTRASPGTRRSSRRSATCTAATSIATSSSPAWWPHRYGSDRGYGLAAYVDGLQSCGRIEEALALDRGRRSPPHDRSATRTGSPTRSGSRGWRSRRRTSHRAFVAWDEGRRLRARAPRPVLRGLPRTRRGSPAHLRRRARGRAGALRRGHRRVPAGRQRSAAGHHARQRARAVRTSRPSRAGRGARRRAVP